MAVLVKDWDSNYLDDLLAEFRAYWADEPYQDGQKTDWDRAWANRLRHVSITKGLSNGKQFKRAGDERGSWLTTCIKATGRDAEQVDQEAFGSRAPVGP